jgi:hypothetical protein
VSAQGYIESEHQVAEADRLEALLKEGWSVLCGYAQQDLHKQMHHVSSYSIGAGPMIHTSTFNLLKFDNFEGSPMDIAENAARDGQHSLLLFVVHFGADVLSQLALLPSRNSRTAK